jgi:hypothetical protein
VSALDARKGFSVLVLDNSHLYDKNEEITVAGFPTLEAAREYARRRTRNSLEELRGNSTDEREIYDLWLMYGETCIVVGGDYRGSSEVDFFISNPADAEEQDWQALTPKVIT